MYLVLVIVIIIIGKVVWLKTQNNIPTLSCTQCKIIYTSDNGSVPPQYHRIYTSTFYRDAENFWAEYKIESGYPNDRFAVKTEVIKEEKKIITEEKFQNLISKALKISPESDSDKLAGCTGGNTESLTIYDEEKIILETSNYNCAGRKSNSSLSTFSKEINELFLITE